MTAATDRIADILLACGTERAHLPPTALYNEGWLLRLVLDWFSRQPPSDHALSFLPGARWFSEALLGSPFRPRYRGDPLAEAWTHADGVIGHFLLRPGRGNIALAPHARQLIVVEAKLFSPLSARTKNAEGYNQSARSVACMADLLTGRPEEMLERVSFVVLAPAEQIGANVFGNLCGRESIASAVANRVAGYQGEKDAWHRDVFGPASRRITPSLLRWEDVLAHIAEVDPEAGAAIGGFYSRCVEFSGATARGDGPREPPVPTA